MHSLIDISVILTAHAEGFLAGPAARSVVAATHLAREAGLNIETIVVLDRADILTKDVLKQVFGTSARYLETDEGDPGQSRNRGIEAAHGHFSTFIDGDDLWSENWLVAAESVARENEKAIYHCGCIVSFGAKRHLYWHIDSEIALFDRNYLNWATYWASMSLAKT